MKKLLFLAYFFPPLGGAGVQRSSKFMKYISEFGYTPLVISGAKREHQYQHDPTLFNDIKEINITPIQLRHIEKKVDYYLKGPLGRLTKTSWLPWCRAAERTLLKAIKKEKPDVMLVTTSPFEAASVMRKVAEKTKIPWVLDMRDPWCFDPITHYTTKLHYQHECYLMRKAWNAADAIILNTPNALHRACHDFRFSKMKSKMYCIPNGWDESDFRHLPQQQNINNNALTIVHTGTFHTRMAIKYQERGVLAKLRFSLHDVNLLTRTPNYLFAACKKLLDTKKISDKDIRFIFVGSASEEDKNLAHQYGIEHMVDFRGYMNHHDSITISAQADLLFLPLHTVIGDEPLIVPGKTYEYLATNKKILACVPEGDVANLVRDIQAGYVCDPTDVDAIAKQLEKAVREKSVSAKQTKNPAPNPIITNYTRKKQTEELAKILDSVCQHRL